MMQNIFSSAYLDGILRLKQNWKNEDEASSFVDNILIPYCKVFGKTLSMVHSILCTGPVYDEEDISLNTLDLNFDMVTLEFADEIIDRAEIYVKSCGSSETFDCIVSHLEFRRNFMWGLVRALDNQYSLAIDNYTACLQNLEIIKNPLAVRKEVKGAFSVYFQHNIATMVPPRPIVIFELDRAVSIIEEIMSDMKFLHSEITEPLLGDRETVCSKWLFHFSSILRWAFANV